MSRERALATVAFAYVVAFVVAVVSVLALRTLGAFETWVEVAVADVAGTIAIFGFSRRFDNSSFYDAYWSVFPIPLAGYLAWLGWDGGADPIRSLLVFALVSAWGVRLTWNWARGWPGIDHEDWRYRDLRAKSGRLQWVVMFFGIHLFPTVQVFLGCLPIFAVNGQLGLDASAPLGWLDAVAVVVTGGAVVIEAVADNQLRDYVLHRKRPGETMTEGVWSWSRHPNYFGELSFWWGLFLFAVAAVGWQPFWLAAGALAMTLMFAFISIPMIEKRMLERRPDYPDVQARISRLIPWPPRAR